MIVPYIRTSILAHIVRKQQNGSITVIVSAFFNTLPFQMLFNCVVDTTLNFKVLASQCLIMRPMVRLEEYIGNKVYI